MCKQQGCVIRLGNQVNRFGLGSNQHWGWTDGIMGLPDSELVAVGSERLCFGLGHQGFDHFGITISNKFVMKNAINIGQKSMIPTHFG